MHKKGAGGKPPALFVWAAHTPPAASDIAATSMPSPLASTHHRRPELGSGSIYQPKTSVYVARWMLKQVQHDVGRSIAPRPPRLCVNPIMCHSRESGERSDRKVNPWTELSAKWFAQRREGIKRLLPVFVSSCELKTRHTRKYRAMGSRFRGNDNFGVLGRVNGYSRRPSVGWAYPVYQPSAVLACKAR
jgi:hypothetical protein